MEGNLALYEEWAQPPKEALKPIEAGRLKGKTDINPMWRIKALTERFGPCGIGWRYEIIRQWTEPGANDEIAAFCNILLFFKSGDGWSEGIPGTGGSAFVAKERNGMYVSDECYKMALTDAISVAAKALGIAANIYWDTNDDNKYRNADDLNSHDIFAIKKRVEQLLTSKLKNLGESEILDALKTNKKAVAQVLASFDMIARFEKALSSL